MIIIKKVNCIEFRNGSREELFSNINHDFPYTASCAELDKYVGRFVPWHWHKEIEMFYIESGILEYYTPQGKVVFTKGSGGIVNSNVLHMTKPKSIIENNIQFLHIFDVGFLSGQEGSRIDKKYFAPFINATNIEIIPLFPDVKEHVPILNKIYNSFKISSNEFGYELNLRSAICDIWYEVLKLLNNLSNKEFYNNDITDKLKMMMIYIHEQYSQKISIKKIANSAYLSERECFRMFNKYLKISPIQYLKKYRIEKACFMLINTKETITNISYECGFGSASYFGKVFNEQIGCNPLEYRKTWQDNYIIKQK